MVVDHQHVVEGCRQQVLAPPPQTPEPVVACGHENHASPAQGYAV
jgi:hypothetical protein